MPLVKINQIIKPIVLIWLLCPILSFSQNIGYVDVGRVIKESNEMIYRGSVIDKLTNQSVKQNLSYPNNFGSLAVYEKSQEGV